MDILGRDPKRDNYGSRDTFYAWGHLGHEPDLKDSSTAHFSVPPIDEWICGTPKWHDQMLIAVLCSGRAMEMGLALGTTPFRPKGYFANIDKDVPL